MSGKRGDLDTPLEERCTDTIEGELVVYAGRYPAFRRWADARARRRAFLQWAIEHRNPAAGTCARTVYLREAAERAAIVRKISPTALCRFVVPNPDTLPALAADLAFLRTQIERRNPPLIRDLNFADHIEKKFGFAADVIYYISVVGHEADDKHTSYGMALITGTGLSDERQAFIRDAA